MKHLTLITTLLITSNLALATFETCNLIKVQALFRGKQVRMQLAKNKEFLDAADSGDLEGVKRALATGADLYATDCSANTAMHNAVVYGEKKDLIQFLIEKGLDINAQNIEGYTALHEYIEPGKSEIISFLLEHGADVNVQNNHGQSALDMFSRFYKKNNNLLRRWPLQVKRAEEANIERKIKIKQILLIHQKFKFSVDKFYLIRFLYPSAFEISKGMVKVKPITSKTTDPLPGD